MNKLKISGLLLLTLVLLVLGAALPRIAAFMQDTARQSHSGHSEMQALQLDLAEERNLLSFMGKLSALGRGGPISISDGAVAMSEAEAYAAAEKAMAAYENARLFQWFDVSYASAQPNISISMENVNHTVVYWTVSYMYKKDPNQTLVLDIDDETGKVLRVTYHKYSTFSMEGVWEHNRDALERFAEVYFSQLGLQEQADQAKAAGYYTFYERDGGVSAAQYIFNDETYGEIVIDLYAEGSGSFYVVIQ